MSKTKPIIHDKSAVKYIQRDCPLTAVIIRIPVELKVQVEEASEKLDTSLNQFVGASIRAYLDDLKKEGSI